MITICIPVYNFAISSLLGELTKQAILLNKPYEIIVIDDCSNSQTKTINKNACKDVTYIELAENIGRSKIRNLFLKYAKYDYLLFLDCDSLINSSGFLLKYINVIEQFPDVVCGGRIYSPQRPPRVKRLRWKYGIQKESQSHIERNKYPNRSFMTNNFLINKKIFEKVRFDERITQYGHEDTLFGYFLKKENITINHIDNPVLNGDLETNKEYLDKTKSGVINLVKILFFTNFDEELIQNVALLNYYQKVQSFEKIIRFIFILSRPLIRFILAGGIVSLYLFNFYKLGILLQHIKIKTRQ